MNAEQFTPETKHETIDAKDLEGYYGSRVSVTEGTRAPDRCRPIQGGLMGPPGAVHRNTVKEYKHVDHNHAPYTTAHRNQHSPSSEFDLTDHTRTQERMLSDKQKRKNRKAK